MACDKELLLKRNTQRNLLLAHTRNEATNNNKRVISVSNKSLLSLYHNFEIPSIDNKWETNTIVVHSALIDGDQLYWIL